MQETELESHKASRPVERKREKKDISMKALEIVLADLLFTQQAKQQYF